MTGSSVSMQDSGEGRTPEDVKMRAATAILDTTKILPPLAAEKLFDAVIAAIMADRASRLSSSPSVDVGSEEVGLPQVPASGAATVWQPIETAPKDGLSLLLADGDTVGEGFYDDAPMAKRAEAGWFWETDRGNLLIAKNCDPTHWMPLPQPPGASPAGDDPKTLVAAARSSSTEAVEQEVEK